jgi:hypothetical protein
MRRLAWFPLMSVLVLAACSSDSAGSSKLTLRNTQWEHVNVQVVITKSSDCDARGPDFVSTQNFVLHNDQTKTIVAPNETNVCWRHDRYPKNPHPGEWSGWSRAIMFPGADTTTDL